MTSKLKISLIALSGALSVGALTAAQAQTAPEAVRISVIGKDNRLVHAEFIRAARQVCAHESTEGSYPFENDHDACVHDTLAKAERDYREMKTLQLAMASGR